MLKFVIGWGLLTLCAFGGVIYVIVHFLHKFW